MATDTRLDLDELARLEEERKFLLRSLDDLEREHDAGDMDEADYQTLKDDYTEMLLKHDAEGIWSNAAGTLTVRRGNVIVRTLPPLAKVPQAKLANDVVGKF